MKISIPFIAFYIIFFSPSLHSQDTFSICAVDTLTGETGSAGASCIGAPQIPQGCYVLSDVHPGVGVIHTQAYYLPVNQNYAGSLMDQQIPPEQIIDSLIAHDAQNNSSFRQYGIVDLYEDKARTAAFTGANCDDYKNHIIGPNYTIQGNILLGQHILDSMESKFLATEGELACRLMAAMQGAKVIGADTRCLDDGVSSLSAFLRVAQPDDPNNNLYLDINISSTLFGIDPIDSLQSVVDSWGGCLSSNINTHEAEGKIILYPNPAGKKLNLKLNVQPTGNKITIVVYTSSGKQILKSEYRTDNSFAVSMDHNLKPGLYYFCVFDNEHLLGEEKVMIID